MEEWRDIKGFEGIYQISNFGRVKSFKGKNERILKSVINTSGYLRVNLHINGQIKNYLVHRLVATHFLSNPTNLNEVNHKDEDKTNNNVINLEWITPKDNCNYGTRNIRIGINSGLTRKNKSIHRPVKCIETNKIYRSVITASNETGIHKNSIGSCCRGEYKTAGKLHWVYISKEEYLSKVGELNAN